MISPHKGSSGVGRPLEEFLDPKFTQAKEFDAAALDVPTFLSRSMSMGGGSLANLDPHEEDLGKFVRTNSITMGIIDNYPKNRPLTDNENVISPVAHANKMKTREKTRTKDDELMYNFQPYKIKSVDPMYLSTREQRRKWIEDARYNLFNLESEQVIIDLLTDSGTGALSAKQTATLLTGDEAYAGASSYFNFRNTVQDLTGFKHIIPVHQGRAAERLLFSVYGGEGKIIPNNTHFDTTRGNIEFTKAKAVDLVIEEAKNPGLIHPFKGNMDIRKLEDLLRTEKDKIPIVMITITNNASGGQPVSMENIKAVRKLCDKYNKPFFIDGCRFAENAYFIKIREKDYNNQSIKDIVREIFSLADGMTMSAKKDGLAHIGGWLALNDDEVSACLENLAILTEGFRTYGGLAGRDLDCIAQGLREVIQEEYLSYRIKLVDMLGKELNKIGVPTVQPHGGHAVFVDAKALLPHITPLQYPGQALAIALYVEGGIRAVEIGSLMFGRSAGETDETPAPLELVRLAIPRRLYTEDQLMHVVKTFGRVIDKSKEIGGLRIVKEPLYLRHFSAELEPLYGHKLE